MMKAFACVAPVIPGRMVLKSTVRLLQPKNSPQHSYTVVSPKGLQLCGLGARDSLRLEAGLPLYGHELSGDISPLMAGLAWTVKFDKAEDFMGKSALVSQKEKGLSHQVIHFTLAGKRIAREGTPVRSTDGKTVGTVLSGTYSPICECPIGSALIAVDAQQDALIGGLKKTLYSTQAKKAPLHTH